MSRKLYKYVGPESFADTIVIPGFVTVKCAFPKDYNDPYAPFLCVDINSIKSNNDPTTEDEMLAFYQEEIRDLPQFPTSCFSNSPAVTSMWVQYANSSTGFVLELNEDKLKEYFSFLLFDDVNYMEEADPVLGDLLEHAFMTKETRFLTKQIMTAAYFSKLPCWSHEQERRMVVPKELTMELNGHLIFMVPEDCVISLIVGANAETKLWKKAVSFADYIGCKLYRENNGKSIAQKYFRDEDEFVYQFDDTGIVVAPAVCDVCSEPLSPEAKPTTCAWCLIHEADKDTEKDREAHKAPNTAVVLSGYLL